MFCNSQENLRYSFNFPIKAQFCLPSTERLTYHNVSDKWPIPAQSAKFLTQRQKHGGERRRNWVQKGRSKNITAMTLIVFTYSVPLWLRKNEYRVFSFAELYFLNSVTYSRQQSIEIVPDSYARRLKFTLCSYYSVN